MPEDDSHPDTLVAAAESLGGIDLLVNSASLLGPSPQPLLAEYPLDTMAEVYRVNVLAPLGLVQQALRALRQSTGAVVTITSDAAVERYEGWGGYGSSKAALDHWTNILGAEESTLHVYSFDPGDMRTQMHQEAFPGEDISDRPLPEIVVPALRRLLRELPPSGRYRAGSSEMPSAGRPFTTEMVTRLVAKDIDVTPIGLHTGVASLEATELPYPERVRVSATTAARINAARATGGRVIAVGTTAVRAVESAKGEPAWPLAGVVRCSDDRSHASVNAAFPTSETAARLAECLRATSVPPLKARHRTPSIDPPEPASTTRPASPSGTESRPEFHEKCS